MMYTRYSYAAGLAAGRRVLELGCGSGQGLGMLRRTARFVAGGDLSGPLLRSGRAHYGPALPLARLSAEALPFQSESFDLVLCFEASYYVPDMAGCFREIDRVLAPGGSMVFVNANPERPDFISSPHSVRYHSADEFRAKLEPMGYEMRVEGAFPVETAASGQRSALVGGGLGIARRALEGLGLVPTTLRGRARLKRLVYGRLREVPAELLEGYAKAAPRVELGRGPVRQFKVVYVNARKTAASVVGPTGHVR